MRGDKKTFKRFMKEYDGATLMHHCGRDSGIIAHIEETASRIDRDEREYIDYKGTYDTECTAVFVTRDGEELSFSYTESIPKEYLEMPVYGVDDDGNVFEAGSRYIGG